MTEMGKQTSRSGDPEMGSGISYQFLYRAFHFYCNGEQRVMCQSPETTMGMEYMDIAVWRPSTGTWYIKSSFDGIVLYALSGTAGDTPVPADYDGDGLTDVAVWQSGSGTWVITRSLDGVTTQTQWGSPGDVPVPGDYDGDGKIDLAVWRPGDGIWYIINSSTGLPTVYSMGNTE